VALGGKIARKSSGAARERGRSGGEVAAPENRRRGKGGRSREAGRRGVTGRKKKKGGGGGDGGKDGPRNRGGWAAKKGEGGLRGEAKGRAAEEGEGGAVWLTTAVEGVVFFRIKREWGSFWKGDKERFVGNRHWGGVPPGFPVQKGGERQLTWGWGGYSTGKRKGIG